MGRQGEVEGGSEGELGRKERLRERGGSEEGREGSRERWGEGRKRETGGTDGKGEDGVVVRVNKQIPISSWEQWLIKSL